MFICYLTVATLTIHSHDLYGLLYDSRQVCHHVKDTVTQDFHLFCSVLASNFCQLTRSLILILFDFLSGPIFSLNLDAVVPVGSNSLIRVVAVSFSDCGAAVRCHWRTWWKLAFKISPLMSSHVMDGDVMETQIPVMLSWHIRSNYEWKRPVNVTY